MSAEKILALVLSIICWSACRTHSRMRERGDRMSGAVATTLATQIGRFIRNEGVRSVSSNFGETLKLCQVYEFRPSPLFEEDEEEGGHHGSEAQTRHRCECRELRVAESVLMSDRRIKQEI